MQPITTVWLDEFERDTLSRVVHLVPLAYPTSDQPAHLRPAGVPPVDQRDPRVRILPALAHGHHQPVTHAQATLAVEVLSRLEAVVRTQADPDWWLGLVTSGSPNDADRRMAQAMASERTGQVPRVEQARTLMEQVAAQMDPHDDPGYWARAEDGLD